MKTALRILLFAVPFSVRRMFFMGEPGLHLEAITPEQNAVNPTMFQDSAGTTPITAIEQPVGLWLDSKLGAVRGPDLRTSGAAGLLGSATAASFNTGTGVGSVTRVDASNQSYVQISGLTASRWYEIRFSAVAGGTLQVRNGNETATVVASFTGSGQCIVNTAGTTITLTASAAATVTFTCAAVQIIPGNHISQSSAGARPTYTRRVNLLTYSEQFDNAAWVKSATGAGSTPTVTPNAGTDPNGGSTADLVQLNCGGTASGDSVTVSQSPSGVAGASYKRRIYVKAYAAGDIGKTLLVRGAASGAYTQVVLDGSWQLVEGAETAAAAAAPLGLSLRGTFGPTTSVDVLVWGADVRPSTIAALNIPAYQRVTSSTDYDTEGFPPRVVGNGTSHFMTASLDMSSTDKVLAVAGVTKYSDAAAMPVFQFTANLATTGAFALWAPPSPAARATFYSKGNGTAASSQISSIAAPVPAVLSGVGNIAADVCIARRDGTPATGSVVDQGAGNYANSTLYLLSRDGASSFSSVGITSLTIRGGDGSAWVSRLENYVKNLMRMNY